MQLPTDVEWAIDQMVALRKEYLVVKPRLDATTDTNQRYVLSLELDTIISKMLRYIKDFYVKGFDLRISASPSNKPSHLDIYSVIWFSPGSFNADNTLKYFIQHPDEYLDYTKRSANIEYVGLQARYRDLKEEVETYIDRFKVMLVSDEFL